MANNSGFLCLSSKEHFVKDLSILRFAKIFAINVNDIVKNFQLAIPNIYFFEDLLKRICKKEFT